MKIFIAVYIKLLVVNNISFLYYTRMIYQSDYFP